MAAIEPQLPLFAEGAVFEKEIQDLIAPTVGEDLYSDYASLGTTLGPHPAAPGAVGPAADEFAGAEGTAPRPTSPNCRSGGWPTAAWYR